MIACPVNIYGAIQAVRKLRRKFRGKARGVLPIPSSDYIVFGEPFSTSYHEAHKIQLGVELIAIRMLMGEYIFTLGEAHLEYSERESLETLSLDVSADEEALELLKKAFTLMSPAGDTSTLRQVLNAGEPRLKVTLFQRSRGKKKPERIRRRILTYNNSLKKLRAKRPEELIRVGDFVPAVYAKYTTGWRKLGRDPETCL